jgi:hypothetical protein
MKKENIHSTRENWLRAATDELRPYFDKLGYSLPRNIRFAISFTSTGKRGRIPIECWHPALSADQHFEIIIRIDLSDPLEVLEHLVAVLVHTLLPAAARRGKEYKAIALRIGLEGPMRHATPTPIMRERLQTIVGNLGPLPHATLHYASSPNAPKKQTARMLKAACGAACGYTIRLAEKWARAGLPLCPIDKEHGPLMCDMPDEGEKAEDQSGTKDE